MIYHFALFISAMQSGDVAAKPKPMPWLQCDARTVTGANLSFVLRKFSVGSDSVVLMTGKTNSAFPAAEETFLLPFVRSGAEEDEYQSGQQLVRIKKDGNVRDLTVWSTRDGKALQPVAFGFCVAGAVAAPATTLVKVAKPFDVTSAAEACYATIAMPEPEHSTFKMSQTIADDRRFFVQFENVLPNAAPATLKRELLKDAPKAEHDDVFMGVGRFMPETDVPGFSGMDALYLDRRTNWSTTLVKFNDLKGKGTLGFGICAAKIKKAEKE